MEDLIFVHTSFEKIFCQNKIKKNCKSVTRKLKKNHFLVLLISIKKTGARQVRFPESGELLFFSLLSVLQSYIYFKILYIALSACNGRNSDQQIQQMLVF